MKNYAVRMTTGNPARRRAHPIRARGLTWAWGGVDFRPIRRWRRLFAALLIVLGAAVAAPEQAAAQTETTFISTTGQAGLNASDANRAQAFTTGTGTYTLSSVALFLHVQNTGTPLVQIYGNTGDTPGTLVANMTNPATIAVSAIHVFTAPANTTLSASTEYWLVTSSSAATTGRGFEVAVTSSSNLDTGTAAGWSLGDTLFRNDKALAWNSSSLRPRFQIRGTAQTTTPNTAPTSANKEVVTDEDTDYTFLTADFAFTDTDMDDTLLSVKIVTLPSKGTLTLSGTALTSGDLPQTVTAADLAASNLKYGPPANESGNRLASFTFRVNDGTDDSVATNTMTIGVQSINDVATGQPGITGTAQVGEVLTATTGDIADVDGLPAPFFESGTTTVQWLRVDGGNETDIPSATDFTYTLVAADEGKTIKVKVVNFNDEPGFTNGPLTSDAYPSSGMVLPAAATNNPPTSADKTVGTPEDTDYTFLTADFAFTDTDMGNTLSSVKIVTLPVLGTLTLSGTALTSGDLPQTVTAAQIGTLKYVPPANDNGSPFTSFTFRVNDGTDNSATPNTMTVNVTAVNDAPTSADKAVRTLEDTEYTFSSADFPFTDTDGDSLSSVKIVSLPAPGTFSLSGTALTSGDLPQTVTAADLTASNLKYAPVANSNLGVTFTFRVNDGTTDSATPNTMTVNVTAVNDAPTSADKTVVTPEDTEYTFSSANFDFIDTADAGSLSSVKIVTLPVLGTLTLSGTALTSGDLPQTVATAQIGTLKYVPPANESGTALASFTFRVNDGTDDSVATNTMTVSVTAVNDAPTGKPGIVGTARVGQVLMATVGTIADPDGLPDPFLTDTSTSFQWVRVTSGTDADISGATASTYTLVDADNGQKIRVKVSFQDKGGSSVVGPFTSDAYPSGATVLPSSTNNPPTSADKVVITDEDTEYTFSSADFDFTDTDTGDTLSSVKIVSLPAPGKGTLTLSGTAITSVALEQTVTAADLAADNLKYVPPANESGAALASFTFRVNDGTDNSATPNTVTVNVTAVNDAATGKPRITGTARVGRVLTATVGTIADLDGLPDPFLTGANTSFQWVRVTSGTDADISGATASTYTLVADDEGKAIRVKVSFQDDDGTNEDPLTSDAYPSGGTVLPASTNAAPTSADKMVDTPEDTEYTFSSADFPFTDTDMGDTLSSVKIVSLPARGMLTLLGTAITSGELPQTVGAAQIGTLRYIPPANESGAALASFTFRVNDGTDDSVATNTMTINVTAVNAATLATLRELSLSVGTLVPEFSPTHFRYRVSVAAGVKRITMMYVKNAGDAVTFLDGRDQRLDDADPGSDTFEVDLSAGVNVIKVEVTDGLPSGSVKAKSALEKVYSVSSGVPTALSAEVGGLFTAVPVTKTYTVTVTVGSSGGFLGSWMARFGRTVADQVLGSVGDRLMAPRTSGTEVRLAGHRLGAVDRDTSDQASGENTARAGTMGTEVEAKAAGKVAREAEKEAERKMAVGLRALTNQLGGDGNNGNYGKSGHDGLFGGFEARAAEQKSRGLTGREMLTSSSFTLTADTAGGDHGALWGRGAVSSFDGRTGGFGLDGEVVSVILGIDRTKGPAVVGVALGHSRGEGAYRSADGEAAHGEIATTLIGIYPYARYEVNERLSVWGVGGHGMGTMTLTPEGLAPMATNTDLVMAALGGRGVLRQPLDGIGLELAVRSDVLAVRTTTKALRGSGVNLAATAAAVTRLRLGLEGTWHNVLPLGLVPTFEIGVRYDGGDAETGFGADLGSGLTWADPVRGIRAAFHARGLVGHEDDGFQELGLSGLLYWDARPDSDLGWSLGIAQTMGARATGGMDALLNPDTTRVFGFDETVDSADSLPDDDLDRRLAADLGYGFAMFGGRYTGTPAVGLRLSEDGRETVLGWSLAESQKSGLVFGLDVAGRRHESVGGEPGHSFGGGFGWQRAGGRSGEPGFGVRFEGERLAADRDGEPEHRFGVQMTARW